MVDGKPNTEELTLQAVQKMFDTENGLLNAREGTKFVAMLIERDPAKIQAATIAWLTPVAPMYDTLRYMIQASWMGGIFKENISMADWTNGLETTEYERFTSGDYYSGAWKDLQGFVSPVFREKYPELTASLVNIHTGSRDADASTQMRLVNANPFANRMHSLYNGEDMVSVSVNPWGAQRVPLGSCTNGNQFKPFLTKDDKVCVHDPLAIRNFEYKWTDTKGKLGTLNTRLLDGSDNFKKSSHLGISGVIDAGASYGLQYVTAL